MSTQITGYSDDTIDIDGDICDDFDCFLLCGGGKGDDDPQYVLACSDGTILRPKYGQVGAIWQFDVVRKGDLFSHVIYGSEEEDTLDIVCFYNGLKWVALAKEEDIRK